MFNAPVATPKGGTYPDTQLTTLTQSDNIDQYYTLDGTDPRGPGYYRVKVSNNYVSFSMGTIKDMCVYNGVIYAVAYFTNVVAKSIDGGLSWINLNAGDFPWAVIRVNKNGVIVVASEATNPKAKYSLDGGTTWVAITNWTSGVQYVHSMGVFDNGTFIVVATNKNLYTSPDGITWTAKTSLSYYANTVSVSGSKAMVTQYGSTNVILKSSDYGATWSTVTAPSSTYWYVCVGDSGRTYIAPASYGNTGYYSDNFGTTWVSAPGIIGLSISSSVVEIGNNVYCLSAGSYRVSISIDRGLTAPYVFDTTLSDQYATSDSPNTGISYNGNILVGGGNSLFTFSLLPAIGTKYTAPFNIASDLTLKAVGYNTVMLVNNYVINRKPYAIPVGGEYHQPLSVELKQEKNLKILYTIDGSEPSGGPYPFGSKGTFTDSRDGKIYRTVFMPDGKWWSIDNLAYAGKSNSIVATNRNGIAYGYDYKWFSDSSTLSTSPISDIPIPTNTHLPSISEWNALFSSVANGKVLRINNSTIWPSFPGTDDYGFSATSSSGSYQGDYWSSTKYGSYYANTAKLTSYDDGLVADTSNYNSADSSGAQVRFIIDSGNVTNAVGEVGTLYTGPIPVNASTVIKAASPYSYVMTEQYIITALRKLYVGSNGNWKEVKDKFIGEYGNWKNIDILIGKASEWK